MIRGISRQIIEVRETENPYYESAYLVVRSEYASAERQVLEQEARRMLRAMDAPGGLKPRFGRWNRPLRLLLPSIIGAGVTAAVMLLIR